MGLNSLSHWVVKPLLAIWSAATSPPLQEPFGPVATARPLPFSLRAMESPTPLITEVDDPELPANPTPSTRAECGTGTTRALIPQGSGGVSLPRSDASVAPASPRGAVPNLSPERPPGSPGGPPLQHAVQTDSTKGPEGCADGKTPTTPDEPTEPPRGADLPTTTSQPTSFGPHETHEDRPEPPADCPSPERAGFERRSEGGEPSHQGSCGARQGEGEAGTDNNHAKRSKKESQAEEREHQHRSNGNGKARRRHRKADDLLQHDSSQELQDEIDASFEAWTYELAQSVRKDPRATDEMEIACLKLEEVKTWDKMKEVLKLLGFNFEAEEGEPWALLGMNDCPEDYNEATSNLLRSRIQTLRHFTNEGATRHMPPIERVFTSNFHKLIHGIEKRANARLVTVRREAQKLRGIVTPQWLEPSAELGKFLDSWGPTATGKVTTCYTFLSNIQNFNIGSLPNTCSVNQTRKFYHDLHEEDDFTKVVGKHKNQTIVIWAPTDSKEIDYLYRGVVKATKKHLNISILLLTPFQALPCSWEHAKPFIRNPFSDGKWNSHLVESSYLEGGTRCVFTGANGPLHQLRNIAIFRVDSNIDPTHGAFNGATVLKWKKDLAEIEELPHVIADYAAESSKMTEHILKSLSFEGFLGWSRATNSRGSSSSLRRRQMLGFFKKECSDLHLNSAVRMLKSNDALRHCLFSINTVFDDPEALIVDMNDTRAITALNELCDQVALVSSRKALINTRVPDGIWSPEITEKAKIHRTLIVTNIARRDGRCFAKPYELPSMRRLRSHCEERSEDPEAFIDDANGTSTITFDGALQILTSQDKEKILKKIQSTTVGTLEMIDGGPYAPLPKNTSDTLRFVADHHGHWNGRIKITFREGAAHRLLHLHVHGAILTVGKRKLSAEVEHSFIARTDPPQLRDSAVTVPIYDDSGLTAITCAEKAKCAANACLQLPCPVCDAPGGANYGTGGEEL